MDDVADEGADHAPIRDGSPWPWLIGTMFPFFAMLAFTAGHAAIDRPEPDRGAALLWYLLAAGSGTAVIVLSILRHQAHMRAIGLWGGLGAIVFALMLGSLAEDSYGPAGAFGMFIVYLYLVIPTTFFGYGTTLLVLGIRRGGDGIALACLVWGTILTVGAMLASMYHVFTLDRQVQLAAEAHEAPGATAVAVVAVLGISAWLSRRSKC